jgi:hypothetical protein
MPPGHVARRAPLVGALLVLALIIGATPAAAYPAGAVAPDPLAAYRGMGAWIDIYDEKAWDHPVRTAVALRRRGVGTLYLETCHFNCPEALYRPVRMAALLRATHAQGIRVVAWYLPGFIRPRRDLQRSLAAIRFRSVDGHRFDSFALDIEATGLKVGVRNRRLVGLSRRLRDQVGSGYSLGAITPPWFYSWRPFPYRSLARSYDVFLPMNYFTVRSHGRAPARVHTRRNIRLIRRGTGDPDVAIHDIGGLAEDLEPGEVRAMVRTDHREGVLGTSLYDSFTTDARGWRRLRAELDRRTGR